MFRPRRPRTTRRIRASRNAAWIGISCAHRSPWFGYHAHPAAVTGDHGDSFFWAMGAVLAAQFPPLVKNALGADQTVAAVSGYLSVGVAIGSVAVNPCWAAKSAHATHPHPHCDGALRSRPLSSDQGRRKVQASCATVSLPHLPNAWMIVLDLLGVAIAGAVRGAALRLPDDHRPKAETARTIAANNIVNSGLMVRRDADRTWPCCGGDRRRQPADRRGGKRRGLVARMEAAPRLRLVPSSRAQVRLASLRRCVEERSECPASGPREWSRLTARIFYSAPALLRLDSLEHLLVGGQAR